MKIDIGEIITLDNNKEYVCFSSYLDGNTNYLYLMSNFKPLEIRFAKQTPEDEDEITIINDEKEKQKLLTLFQNRKDVQ